MDGDQPPLGGFDAVELERECLWVFIGRQRLPVDRCDDDVPTLFIAWTIKGHGLRCQALSGNHSAMPDQEELKEMAKRLGASFEEPFEEPLDREAPDTCPYCGASDFRYVGAGYVKGRFHGKRTTMWVMHFGRK